MSLLSGSGHTQTQQAQASDCKETSKETMSGHSLPGFLQQ